MQCGAKCFLVTIEKENGQLETMPVHARTQVLARKTVRQQVSATDKIVKVQLEKTK